MLLKYLLLFLLIPIASADISSQNYTTNLSKTINITVWINGTNLTAAQVNFNYDQNFINIISVKKGTFLQNTSEDNKIYYGINKNNTRTQISMVIGSPDTQSGKSLFMTVMIKPLKKGTTYFNFSKSVYTDKTSRDLAGDTSRRYKITIT